ncbi:putative membrane protein [Chitinophaga skermanii]|uniref:Putative membrane protein n=1 Tax=Chitinophaga skermanii TaxID=331697 RepID=A0A327Q9G7_9BACT|nr:DMT family transporter [Chitinophaga skermanii]RAJ00342.1 putative membrane protein [Chitinophaga skermanii]
MSLSALTLIIIAAIVHAFWNFTTKKVNGKLPFYWCTSLFAVGMFVPYVVYQLFQHDLPFDQITLGFSALSAVLHLLYFVALQTGYRKADLSVVYPIARGSGPLCSVTGAILLFHEKPGTLAILGIVLIILGVVMMTLTGWKHDKRIVTGLGYGALTGLFIASYTIADKIAVVDYHVSVVFITLASMILPFVLLFPYTAAKRSEYAIELKTHWKPAFIVAACQPLSYILVLIAMKTTPVSYVAPARELSIVFGVFFGVHSLKEKDRVKRILGALVILAGIVLLAID